MICGTTPTHIFTLPFDSALVKEAQVIYAQGGMEVLRKDTQDFEMDGQQIGVTLTQEETLSFDHRQNVQVQLRILSTEGVAYASNIYTGDVKQCLSGEVIR